MGFLESEQQDTNRRETTSDNSLDSETTLSGSLYISAEVKDYSDS